MRPCVIQVLRLLQRKLLVLEELHQEVTECDSGNSRPKIHNYLIILLL